MYIKSKYNVWCNRNDFESKLPKVVKARKDAKGSEDRSKQSSLDPHLEGRRQESFIAYSNAVFREAAIEWLIETDQVTLSLFLIVSDLNNFKMQPIQALENSSFQKMIDVASRATKGVIIPNRKAARKHIIELFKKNLNNLRLKITVRFLLIDIFITLIRSSERQDRPDKSHVRCLASRKSRCIFCGNRPLDRRAVTGSLGGSQCITGFHADEHCT